MYFTAGGLILVMSLARVTVIRFHETPKYLICKGKDEEVVAHMSSLATKYGRTCSLTLDLLSRHGRIATPAQSRISGAEIWTHYKGLFSTRKLAVSTSLVWLSWALIGLAFPLFYVFLPEYLASRGAEFGDDSPFITWRNYVLTQFSSIFGPLVAAYLSRVPPIGRKWTMVIGALLTSKSNDF